MATLGLVRRVWWRPSCPSRRAASSSESSSAGALQHSPPPRIVSAHALLGDRAPANGQLLWPNGQQALPCNLPVTERLCPAHSGSFACDMVPVPCSQPFQKSSSNDASYLVTSCTQSPDAATKNWQAHSILATLLVENTRT